MPSERVCDYVRDHFFQTHSQILEDIQAIDETEAAGETARARQLRRRLNDKYDEAYRETATMMYLSRFPDFEPSDNPEKICDALTKMYMDQYGPIVHLIERLDQSGLSSAEKTRLKGLLDRVPEGHRNMAMLLVEAARGPGWKERFGQQVRDATQSAVKATLWKAATFPIEAGKFAIKGTASVGTHMTKEAVRTVFGNVPAAFVNKYTMTGALALAVYSNPALAGSILQKAAEIGAVGAAGAVRLMGSVAGHYVGLY